MGLDVNVYKNIKRTDNDSNYKFTACVIDENWKYKIKNLEYGKNYTGDCMNVEISYAYSTHNRFREILIKIIERNDLLCKNGEIDWIQLEDKKEMPFYELINFADNGGCLDFEINTILYNNFVEWKDKAMKFLEQNDYFKDIYLNWLNIFKEGKNNGVVVFS